MTLSELARWGVVRKVWIQGERKDFYAAEVQLWRMISRVFNEREKSEIISAIDAFEEALRQLDRIRKTAPDALDARAGRAAARAHLAAARAGAPGQAAARRARVHGEGGRRAARALLAGAALLTAGARRPGASRAHARCAAGADASPSNDYNIEIFQGPLLAPDPRDGRRRRVHRAGRGHRGRRGELGAPAVRDAYSTTWFDHDLAVGISFPGAFTSTDFDDHGDNASLPAHARERRQLHRPHASAARCSSAASACAATGDLEQFSLTTTSGEPSLTLQVGRCKALASYGLYGGQLALGGGARVVTMQIQQNGAGPLLTMTGAAPEAGALLMPTGLPWRLGATVRAPVNAGVGVGFLGQRDRPRLVDGAVRSVEQPRAALAGRACPGRRRWASRCSSGRGRSTRAGRTPTRRRRTCATSSSATGRSVRAPATRTSSRRSRRRSGRARIAEQASAEKALRAHRGRAPRRGERAPEPGAQGALRELAAGADPPARRACCSRGQSPHAVSVEGFLDQRVETVGRQLSVTPARRRRGRADPRRGRAPHRDVRGAVALRGQRARGSTSRSAATSASSR